MPLASDTTTTTTTAMTTTTTPLETELDQLDLSVKSIEAQTISTNHNMDNRFDKSQCLFCPQTSRDLDQNLIHMSKSHGLHVDSTNLSVEIGSLLAYLHLVIFRHHKCLFCGTQRSSHLAVQQHMTAKGHCKFEVMGKDPILRDFFDLSLDEEETFPHNRMAVRVSGNPQLASHDRSKKERPLKRSKNRGSDTIAPPLDQAPSNPMLPIAAESGLSPSQTPSRSLANLSTRAMKQEYTLNNQLAQLRADDRRSLSHLPPAQQRALLLTHHKQTENARRLEQTYRGNLESAGNKFNCLGKIRLIRKPPHTGNVHSLNR